MTYSTTYLRWMKRKMMPITKQMQPTTTYAMPRNGFLPPSKLVVDMITLFVPLNCCTYNES